MLGFFNYAFWTAQFSLKSSGCICTENNEKNDAQHDDWCTSAIEWDSVDKSKSSMMFCVCCAWPNEMIKRRKTDAAKLRANENAKNKWEKRAPHFTEKTDLLHKIKASESNIFIFKLWTRRANDKSDEFHTKVYSLNSRYTFASVRSEPSRFRLNESPLWNVHLPLNMVGN